MGLRESESYDLLLPEMIPQFQVSVEDALNYARKNRSAFIAFERRRLEAERDVAQARGQRFQSKLSADVVAHLRRSRSSTCDNRNSLTDGYHDSTQPAIFSPEVMTPFGNTMCFIDGEERKVYTFEKFNVLFLGE